MPRPANHNHNHKRIQTIKGGDWIKAPSRDAPLFHFVSSERRLARLALHDSQKGHPKIPVAGSQTETTMSFRHIASGREMCVYLPKRPFVRAPTRVFAAVFRGSDVRTASNFNPIRFRFPAYGFIDNKRSDGVFELRIFAVFVVLRFLPAVYSLFNRGGVSLAPRH